MAETSPTYTFKVTIPGDIDYIPSVRKFVSSILQAFSFSQKFAYRSEIVVDEVCNNAIAYGCKNLDDTVQLTILIQDEKVELLVKDHGGTTEDRQKLAVALEKPVDRSVESHILNEKALGLEIVRMLSEEMDFGIDTNNVTSVRVVRKREEAE